jgi:hypothetical protein
VGRLETAGPNSYRFDAPLAAQIHVPRIVPP